MTRTQLAVGLFILMATLTTAAVAQSGVVTSTVVVSAPGTIYDDCTKEVVDYNGTFELTMDVWVDANGTHLRTKDSNVNVAGVGETTGNDYRVQSGGQTIVNTTAEGLPTETSSIMRMGLIGLGPAANEHVLFIFHQTIDRNGNATADVEQMIPKCNGR